MARELLIGPDFDGDVVHYSEPDGEGGLLIHSVQDIEPILEANKAALNSGHDGYSGERERRRVATIPAIVRLHFMNSEGWDPGRPDLYPEKVAWLLNNPDYAWLRNAPGRVAAVNGVLR